MNILGLHFGHDASVTVLVDGAVAAYVLCERYRRVKHAISLRMSEIELAVSSAGLTFSDIDFCAICSTQNIELIIDDPKRFDIRFQKHPKDCVRSAYQEQLDLANAHPSSMFDGELRDILYQPRHRESVLYKIYRHYFPQHEGMRPEDFHAFGWIDNYLGLSTWRETGLCETADLNLAAVLNGDDLRLGQHLPVTVELDGISVPGFYVNHHAAHAAVSYYTSRMNEAAILSHDGMISGAGTQSGMFFYGKENRLYPLAPHHLFAGALYDTVGMTLQLGDVGPAGKLMGLASYGHPRFFHRSYVGNWFDAKRQNLHPWLEYCGIEAREMNYDLRPLGERDQMTAPINVDIAASTQKLFEEIYLSALETLHRLLERHGLHCTSVCLSGGTALNCPSNTRMSREGPFNHVFIPPGCDDSGISVGAAMFVYYNLLDQPLSKAQHCLGSPYLGLPGKTCMKQTLESVGPSIEFEHCNDVTQNAADDLAADRVLGWFESRSEIGPRALGHRSILADPRKFDNWARVNQMKRREPWRPLAPAVLACEASKWFRSVPADSPYMLFNATVTSTQIPAVTHVDGSARIQTVGPACGQFHRLIEAFAQRTGVPVVLNTSFNGPGEPLVESPTDALNCFAAIGLDVLYLDGYRVTRR